MMLKRLTGQICKIQFIYIYGCSIYSIPYPPLYLVFSTFYSTPTSTLPAREISIQFRLKDREGVNAVLVKRSLN